MHLRQWVGRPDRGLSFDNGDFTRFYVDSVSAMSAAGMLMLSELRLDSRPIAFYYSYYLRDCYYGYRPTYETAYGKLSPGGVLHLELLESLHRLGFHRFDFMRGAMDYKFRYASGSVRNASLAFTQDCSEIAPSRGER
jgi:CelD/BcsL family acetyltransferase involved in cellulose biosynthesis